MRTRISMFPNHRLTAGLTCLQTLPACGRRLSAAIVEARKAKRRQQQARIFRGILVSILGFLLVPVAGLAQVSVSLPTLDAPYGSVVHVPVQVGAVIQEIVAVELDIAYDSRHVAPQAPQTSGTLTDGWWMNYNTLAGAQSIDTLKVVLFTTLGNSNRLTSAGVLLSLPLQTADLRQPTTTFLRLVRVRLNEGQPAASAQHGALILTGADGSVSADPEPLTIGETLTITVADPDENTDTGAIETLQVEVSCELQSEWVTLTETGANTGIFTGSISTTLTTTDPVSGSERLELQDDDILTITYVDQLASCGSDVVRRQTVQAIAPSSPTPDSPVDSPLDESTVALYRFAGDLRDEGPHGLHLQAQGNARVVDGALQLYEVGDRVTVAIPDELLMPGGSPSPLTLEARFYVRAYKTYSLSNYPIIALEQAWDAQFNVRDDRWDRYPRVIVGNSHPLNPSQWAARVSFDTWHTLTITHDSEGLTSIFIDGELAGQSTFTLHYGRTNDWTLTLGNFDGQIDQVRISNIVREAPAVKPAVAALENSQPVPSFALLPNYPNPFNPSTTLRYALPEAAAVQLAVYNVMGQRIRTLVDEYQTAGFHAVVWDGRDSRGIEVGSGIYLSRINAGQHIAFGKMFLVK